jgi:uncharacterized GH25 family protein
MINNKNMNLKKKAMIQKWSGQYHKLLLLLALIVLCSHNLYVKLETYFLNPNTEATLSLYNGTFENSENIITRDRMLDASFVAQGKRVAIQPDQWKDQDSTITQLTFNTGEAGTYVVGVATKARNIALSAEKFNDYLKHDGVLEMLARRTENNVLDQDAVESYEKHVKAIYQVGDIKTDDWKTILGYPIEFVPVSNPYEKHTGDKLEVQLLLDGKPLANQLVYANHIHGAHNHDHGDHDHKDGNHKDGDHKHDHDHKDGDHKHDHDHKDGYHKHDHDHKDGDHKHDHDHKDGDHKHDHDHKDGDHKHDHDHKDGDHKHDHDHKDGDHKHDHDDKSDHEHTHTDGQQLITNDQGIVTVDLTHDGIYYLRTIHMVNVTDDKELTHRSKWATLTFEVTHSHDHDHDHDHDHEEGIPTWVFILGSILIVGILFLAFRKKS